MGGLALIKKIRPLIVALNDSELGIEHISEELLRPDAFYAKDYAVLTFSSVNEVSEIEIIKEELE